jgi:hypothetical protein
VFSALFVIYCCVLVSSRRCLDVSLFEKIQDCKEEDLEQQQAGSKEGDP